MRPEPRRAFWPAVLAALRTVAGPTLPLPPAAGLRCCPACGRDRLAVVWRSHHGEGLGALGLRCGECGATRQVVASRAEADALLAWHAGQRRAIAEELSALDSRRLSAELAALLRANS